MGLPFADRGQAGKELGAELAKLELERPIVVGVPRGGVAVAAPAAAELGTELDVIIVRKIGAPHNPELGIGAVGAWGEPWLDQRLIATLGVPAVFLEQEIERQRAEARRRLEAYRGDASPLEMEGRDVVVVDDGIATGGTVIAAANLLRAQRPRRLLLAVPVAPREGLERVRAVYDDVVALYTPEPYFAVGQWYRDFHQVDDEEVRHLLAAARGGPGAQRPGQTSR